ncbi:hypothetical protein M407DRAFT_224483 [Tulasnella calospora MUT 4182]|uniref:Protein kinase domain-containing protein n=1 Tax=Tulasnella calospora MUT 4182 TaxID=1051891 RepID=A0A0C3Q6H1_9AGAM|nr:hypothetical protein M407DRAFT_224483 [Tulasnella calospora MUT 4182]
MDHGIICSPQSLTFRGKFVSDGTTCAWLIRWHILVTVQKDPSNGSSKWCTCYSSQLPELDSRLLVRAPNAQSIKSTLAVMLQAFFQRRKIGQYEIKEAKKNGISKCLRISIEATPSGQVKATIVPPATSVPYVSPSQWKSGSWISFTLRHPIDGKRYSAQFAMVGADADTQGGYAEVWKCHIRAKRVELPWSLVAVKSFRYETLPPVGETVLNKCLITIWYECGTLFETVSKQEITADRIRILKEMADGLEYLHSKNVIHGDIHNGNVLATLDENGLIHPIYIDFGLSKVLEESYRETIITSTIRQKGRMIYMAPELLRYTYPPRHKASDVYAFGLLLLEVASNRTAFRLEQENMPAPTLQARVVDGSVKPDQARFDFIRSAFWGLLSSCWETEATSRPPIEDVRRRLGAMHNRDYY